MLPIQNRLKNSKEIQEVFKKGETSRSGFLFLKKLKKENNPNLISESKIAILIGKNFSNKATDRNKLKRFIREAVRNYVKILKPNYHIVIWIKFNKTVNEKSIIDKNGFFQIKQLIDSLIEKSKLKIK